MNFNEALECFKNGKSIKNKDGSIRVKCDDEILRLDKRPNGDIALHFRCGDKVMVCYLFAEDVFADDWEVVE